MAVVTVPPVLVDNHMHLAPDDVPLEEAPNYGLPLVRRYASRAAAVGIDAIAVTEHVYRFSEARDVWPEHAAWADQATAGLTSYVEILEEARAESLEVPVLLGIEADHIHGHEAAMAGVLQSVGWDVVLGSVHWPNEMIVDRKDGPDGSIWDELSVDEVWSLYATRLCEAALTGLYDVMAHPDLPKKYGDRPSPRLLRSVDNMLAEAFSEARVAFEVNSAGLRKPVGELYPSQELLILFHRAGLDLSLGSDAHAVDDVGRDIEVAAQAAWDAGFRTVTEFRRRGRRQVPLG
jgi:histidinol-phosphatase (PHP family)